MMLDMQKTSLMNWKIDINNLQKSVVDRNAIN